MTVNEMLTAILEFSHDEHAPDTELRSKALGWLNHAYLELMDEVSAFTEGLTVREETVQSTAEGLAVLAMAPRRILNVQMVESGKRLNQLQPREALVNGLKGFVQQIEGLRLFPAEEVLLKVAYVPSPVPLSEDTPETNILLPLAHQRALVWGALVWSAFYERGINTQGEIALFQEKWEEAKRGLKLALSNAPLRVKAYDF